ncbi:MAG: DUF3990 domain-containing protein [Oscillospiraceae bacterium]|nr:DUF3990 domain-containing protein [Oscillospiraceae bacterium]
MLVYHGSNVEVDKPRIITPNRTLDYGRGFYTTVNLQQAESFANNVVNRNDGRGKPTVSYYEIDYEKIKREFIVLEFSNPDDAWLDFVYANRAGKYIGKQYDVVTGPVANDSVYRVLRLFENGDIDRETAIKRLKTTKLFNQLTFCTEQAIKELRFVKSEVVKVEQER